MSPVEDYLETDSCKYCTMLIATEGFATWLSNAVEEKFAEKMSLEWRH